MVEDLEPIPQADLIAGIKNDLLTNPANNSAFYIDGVEIAAQVVASRTKAAKWCGFLAAL